MPRIPRFQERSRLTGPSPVNAVDPSLAARRGQQIAQLGQDVQRFAAGWGQYQENRQRVDDAVLKNDVKLSSTEIGHKALLFARENPEGAEDGSSMERDFESVVSPLMDRISQLPASRQKIAMQEAQAGLARYRMQMREASVARHNSFVGEKTVDSARRMTFNIMQDPTSFNESLESHLELINSLPVSSEERSRATKEAQLDATLAVVSGYEAKHQYGAAREFLMSPESQYLDRDQRQKALDRVTQQEWSHRGRVLSEQDRAHMEMERDQKRQKADFEAQSFTRVVEAQNPEERQAVLDDVLAGVRAGVTNRVFYKALQTQDRDVLDGVSAETEFAHTQRLLGGDVAGAMERIASDVANGDLKPSAGASLSKLANRIMNNEERVPGYRQKRQQSSDLIKSSFPAPPSFMGVDPVRETSRQNDIIRTQQRASDLEAEGVDLVQATRQAILEVRADQASLISIPGASMTDQSSVPAIQTWLRSYDQRFQAIENPTPVQLRRYNDVLQAAEDRIEGLRAIDQLNQLAPPREN
jgi:hypothetical protein